MLAPASCSDFSSCYGFDAASNYCDALARFGDSVHAAFSRALHSAQTTAEYIRTELHAFSLSKAEVVDMNNQFAATLRSVSSLQDGDVQSKSTILTRDRLIQVLTQIQRKTPFSEVGEIIATISNGKKPSENLTAEEFAALSFMLHDLTTNYGFTQQTLKILTYLKKCVDLACAQLAREKIIDQLEQHYQASWKLGTISTTYYGAKVGCGPAAGVEVGLSLALGKAGVHLMGQLCIGKEHKQFIDDANNLVQRELVVAGLTGEAKVQTIAEAELPGVAKAAIGAEISAKAEAKLLAGVTGDIKLTGAFKEWATPRAYVIDQFDVLMKKSKHLNDPKIQRYLSRHNMLSHRLPSDKQPSAVLLAATRHEFLQIDIAQLKAEYALTRNLMDNAMNVFVQSDTSLSKSIQKNSLTKINDSSNLVLNGTLLGGFGKVTPLCAQARAEAEVALPVIGKAAVAASAAVSASGQVKHLNRQVIAYTPINKRLNDLQNLLINQTAHSDIEKKAKTEKQIQTLQQQINEQARVFKNSISAHWKKEESIKIKSRQVNWGKTKEEIDAHVQEQVQDFGVNAEQDFQRLKNDFNSYTQWQALIALHGRQTEDVKTDLTEFLQRYGVINSNQLVHRMVMANACLYSQTKDPALQAAMLEFEEQLLSPDFAVDKDYLKDHAYFREKVNYSTTETKFEAELKFDVAGVGAKGKLEWTYCRQKHTDQLRDGDYIDVTLTLSKGITSLADVIASVTPHFTQHLSDGLTNQILDQITDGFCGSFEAGSVIQFRTTKPNMFADCKNFANRELFWRKSVVKEQKIERGFFLLVKPGVDISAGLEHQTLSAHCVKQLFHPKTTIEFFTLFMHSLQNNFSKETNGTIITDQDSEWDEMIKEQQTSLKQLFKQYAQELKQSGGADSDRPVSQEITVIGNLIKNNTHLSADVYARYMEQAGLLQQAVQAYVNDDETQFKQALHCFEKLMHVYFTHWSDQKTYSYLHQALPLTALEKPAADTATQAAVALRIAAAKQKQALAECEAAV